MVQLLNDDIRSREILDWDGTGRVRFGGSPTREKS